MSTLADLEPRFKEATLEPGFACRVRNEDQFHVWVVKQVGERTAVLAAEGRDARVVPFRDVIVDPAHLEWTYRKAPEKGDHFRRNIPKREPRPPSNIDKGICPCPAPLATEAECHAQGASILGLLPHPGRPTTRTLYCQRFQAVVEERARQDNIRAAVAQREREQLQAAAVPPRPQRQPALQPKPAGEEETVSPKDRGPYYVEGNPSRTLANNGRRRFRKPPLTDAEWEAIEAKRQRAAARDAVAHAPDEKVCLICLLPKPLGEFAYHPKAHDNKQAACRQCQSATNRKAKPPPKRPVLGRAQSVRRPCLHCRSKWDDLHEPDCPTLQKKEQPEPNSAAAARLGLAGVAQAAEAAGAPLPDLRQYVKEHPGTTVEPVAQQRDPVPLPELLEPAPAHNGNGHACDKCSEAALQVELYRFALRAVLAANPAPHDVLSRIDQGVERLPMPEVAGSPSTTSQLADHRPLA